MERFLGVKFVEAKLMKLGSYNIHRGWDIPPDEDPEREGYLVRYPDGYESWGPKEQFETANRLITDMPFGHAIEAAKQGRKIARRKWNGKDMYVVYMEKLMLPPYNTAGTDRKVNDRTARFIGKDQPLNCQPYFAMFNAQKEWIPGWLASQSDMLDDDWYILED